MWSTGFRTSGRQTSTNPLPSTVAIQGKWQTTPSWKNGIPVKDIDHFTHIPPKNQETINKVPTFEDRTGYTWDASNYGRTQRGWDTGHNTVQIEIEQTSNLNEKHLTHHNNLHAISLQGTQRSRRCGGLYDTNGDCDKCGYNSQRHKSNTYNRRNQPILKIHRYAWNKEPLIVGGVDTSEPKTLHLSKRMSEWKRRSEKQLLINKNAGKKQSTTAGAWNLSEYDALQSQSFQSSQSSSKGIQLDPGKFRRRQEARERESHDTTLLGSFKRMHRYTPNISNSIEKEKRKNIHQKYTKRNSFNSVSLKSSMPRALKGSIGGSENKNPNGTLLGRRRGSRGGSRRGSRRGSRHGSSPSTEKDVTLPRWEQLRNQLTEVIVGEGLYRLRELRVLFDETLKNASRQNEKELALQAIIFVCNELDIPAIGRLATENPELLVSDATDADGTVGRRGRGNGLIDSEGDDAGPILITHWSQALEVNEWKDMNV